MSKLDEKQQLIALAGGDTKVFQALFFEYHPILFRRVFSIVRDKSIADDLAQQVFIRLWEKRKTIKIDSNFGAYLMKMGVNEALGYIRQQKTNIIPLENRLDQEPAAQFSDDGIRREEQMAKIDDALNVLPNRCREIFLLSRKQHLTYQEIATTLSISKKTVEAQMGKALMLLRKHLLALISLTGLPHFF